MKIVRMIRGEVVEEREFKSKLTELSPLMRGVNKYIDLTAVKFVRRLNRIIDKEFHFIESGMDVDRHGFYIWFIFNLGDNCLKIYPEDGCYVV